MKIYAQLIKTNMSRVSGCMMALHYSTVDRQQIEKNNTVELVYKIHNN